MTSSGDSDAGAREAPLIALRGLHKRFGGVHALRGAGLSVSRPGVVHVLLGSNGSGKSTLLGILSGQLQPDAGTITLDGQEVTFRSPADAVSKGVAMVSQETSVAGHLSVTENILLGRRLVRTATGIDWAASRRRAIAVMEMLEIDYDPDLPVHALRPDQRQMVEIARAVSMNTRILILDEPTSSLTDTEVQALFAVIRRLVGAGVSVVFVSHRLAEVEVIGGELTVLRNGQTVVEGLVADHDAPSMVRAMVGDTAAVAFGTAASQPRAAPSQRPRRLEVEHLRVAGAVGDVSLDVRSGEIVGVAGLEGAGRSELVQAVFGIRPVSGGRITIDGKVLHHPSPRHAIAHGLGYVPPDRKSQGVVLTMSVEANLRMVATRDAPRLGMPRGAASDSALTAVIDQMRIRTASRSTLVGQLSGGNQQKVALAKWLLAAPSVLLLEEPTRGVDVAAKAEIYLLLKRAAADGLAILVSSSENDELITLCDRILVMFRGQIVAALSPETTTEGEIARIAGGR